MSDQPRALPDRPNLRYLKLEAKRRRSAGEFATLDHAQLAIAREHGLPSWAALKHHLDGSGSHAVTHVRWVMARFAGADAPGWTPPDEDELRRHFDDRYVGFVTPEVIIRLARTIAGQLRHDLTEVRAEPFRMRGRIADLRVEAATEADPPHRITTLRFHPLETTIADPRVAAPPTHTTGAVPAEAAAIAEQSYAELGLVGLIVAGAGDDGSVWGCARGWASLERGEALRTDHRIPAHSVTELVTALAVLRLVADGRVGLDEPANTYLRAVRLADDAVTVRELLSHSGGVDQPAELFADAVPDPVSVTGPIVACGGSRGTLAYPSGGYAALGQLVADVTAAPYERAAGNLVLEPLGMSDSWFPRGYPLSGSVDGHRLTGDGMFERAPRQVRTVPAAGGLWTSAADLVRFGLGWSALLPGELAREALRPQAGREDLGGQAGLGWFLVPPKDVAGHPGSGTGSTTSLIIMASTGRPFVVFANRQVSVESVNERLAVPLA